MNNNGPLLKQSFEQLRVGLEMKPDHKRAIDAAQTRCREHLQKKWPGAEVFISGSYGRSTKIEPIKDIDLFVAKRDSYPEIQKIPITGHDLLLELQGLLREPFGSEPFVSEPRKQKRSMGLAFPGFRMDVVPAVKRNGGGYFIADLDLPSPHWRFTHPKKQKEFTAKQDQSCGQMAVPLVKMFKHWNTIHHLGLKSFHLEVMVLRSLSAKPESYAAGAQQVLSKLVSAIQQSCGDPGESGGKLDEYLSGPQRARISDLAQAHATLLKEAQVFDQAKQGLEAQVRFKKVFG